MHDHAGTCITDAFLVTDVPEPGFVALLAAGLVGFGVVRQRGRVARAAV